MNEKDRRVDTAGPVSSLTSNPFSQLAAVPRDWLPEGPVGLPQASTRTGNSTPCFRVGKTKKGGYPISMERRAAGKSVTIIRNLSGDTEALLALLKKHCAAGGKAFADSVEVQGDHGAKIEAFLRDRGF